MPGVHGEFPVDIHHLDAAERVERDGALAGGLEPGFLERVLEMGMRFKQKLASICDSHPDLFETIRGEGLMLGLKCKVPNHKIIDALYDQRLLAVPAGDNVVRMLPPLTVEPEHIDLACERLEAACAKVSVAEEPAGA